MTEKPTYPIKTIQRPNPDGKPGLVYALVRGKRKVGEARRNKSGAWVGYRWGKHPVEVAKAQRLGTLIGKMEGIV